MVFKSILGKTKKKTILSVKPHFEPDKLAKSVYEKYGITGINSLLKSCKNIKEIPNAKTDS